MFKVFIRSIRQSIDSFSYNQIFTAITSFSHVYLHISVEYKFPITTNFDRKHDVVKIQYESFGWSLFRKRFINVILTSRKRYKTKIRSKSKITPQVQKPSEFFFTNQIFSVRRRHSTLVTGFCNNTNTANYYL